MNPDGTFNVRRQCRRRRLADAYHTLLSTTWRRFVAILVAAYLLVNVLFATAYVACGPGALDGAAREGPEHVLDAFFFSVQTLSTVGYGKITPVGLAANLVVTAESVAGLLVVALSTGLMFARFSRPTARVLFSNRALISMHDGVRSFLFRMANERQNQIVEANIHVALAHWEETAEGERYRTFVDLPLERARSPFFTLSWTVVHPIDERSPLAGFDLERLREAEAEIFVSLHGIDDTLAQAVHAQYSYTGEEIVWDGVFEDMLGREDGLVVMDLTKIHEVRAARAGS
jgi:inward rectifier potassium channel